MSSAAAKSLSALLQQASIDDHEEILKACNNALKTSKNDPELLHVRFVALIKLDRYDDALQIVKESGDKFKDRAKIECAYALYKTGQLEEAKSLAKSITNHRGARHVEAQASYRSEDFANAAKLYKGLANGHTGLHDEESDLRINSSAVDAQLEWANHGALVANKKPSREALEAFETAYNAACSSIARSELGQASILLKRANDLCMSIQDLSDAEKQAEVLPIRVQQLYVATLLGKTDEANKLASEIPIQEIPDLSSRRLAQNNVIASESTPSNPYLDRKILDVASTLPKNDQLFTFQDSQFQENSLILDLLAQKPKAVITATEKAITAHQPTTSPHVNSLSALNAAANAQGDLAKLGLKQILPLFEKRPNDVGLAMTVIQLYCLTNNHGSAITVLDKLLAHLSKSTDPSSNDQDVLHAPGLVALQVSLYRTQNRKTPIKAAFARAASYWRHKSKPLPTDLLQAAGTALLDSSPEHRTLAAEIFETLHTADPDSKPATAGFIASHALTSPASISETNIDTLPPLAQQINAIDIDALEEGGVPALPVTTTDPTTTTPSSKKRGLDEKANKPAKKRMRKSRIPKDFDPNRKPDPERWLPLQERSTYKPNKKKGKGKGRGGGGEADRERTQGGVVSEKQPEKGAQVVGGGGGGGSGGGGKGKGGKKKGKR